MHVKVKHRLPCTGAGVYDRAVTVVALKISYARSNSQQMAQQSFLFL